MVQPYKENMLYNSKPASRSVYALAENMCLMTFDLEIYVLRCITQSVICTLYKGNHPNGSLRLIADVAMTRADCDRLGRVKPLRVARLPIVDAQPRAECAHAAARVAPDHHVINALQNTNTHSHKPEIVATTCIVPLFCKRFNVYG